MTASSDWQRFFGHETPYDMQRDGIETAIESGQEGGYLALEGACGTGKTMLSLAAGLALVRDPDTDFERVLVLTSVKQQLRQFESDLEVINEGLTPEQQVSGLTLVGKADLCPYVRGSTDELDETTVYDGCERLRETTRALTDERSAGELVTVAQRQHTHDLTAAETLAPYDQRLPAVDETGGEATFCPFYARYFEALPEDGDRAEAVPFDPDDLGLLDTEALIGRSIEHGTCPHSMLTALIETSEVIIGNYYHAFDPLTTRAITGGIIDESTYLVCDEAHMLEPRVRDLLGESLGEGTLQRAIGELDRIRQPLRAGDTTTGVDAAAVRAELETTDHNRDDIEHAIRFLRGLRETVDELVGDHLEDEHPDWQHNTPETIEMPLRDPGDPGVDAVSEWATDIGAFGDVSGVCRTADRVLDALDEEENTDRAVPTVARMLQAWGERGHERFFRSIRLQRRASPTAGDTWQDTYRAQLHLHNCVPGDAIGERLAEFGGGILMSATLEPMDVFATVTGLDHLAETADRPVVTRQYGLQFPPENRASFAVAAPKFTYGNRGDPDHPRDLDAAGGGDVRAVYADAIRTVATVPGNVLVCMPSYREAEWASNVLKTIDKPVLLDAASDEATTDRLKQSFFAGSAKVLVTSLRGTLTEGVDYSGDRLAAAVVCGVPIVDTASPRTEAIRAAYDRAFGDTETGVGFEYALAIPAVRKARQAIGRVIRGQEDVGVRVLVDERYAREGWDSLNEYVSDEFETVTPDLLSVGLKRFWDRQKT